MTAYYNEIEPFAAQWLRNLISEGHIAPGEVDERSITEVQADDLAGFSQCHFFAGIGVWSYALRQAGWEDTMPVWTGSAPCQPFSVAGAGKGKEDERHLWPHLFRLIQECRPRVCFGEQVAGKAGLGWFDDVSTDLEGEDYATGAVTFPACGIGAPHQRQRLYWVADDQSIGLERRGLAHSTEEGLEGLPGDEGDEGGCVGCKRDEAGHNAQGVCKPTDDLGTPGGRGGVLQHPPMHNRGDQMHMSGDTPVEPVPANEDGSFWSDSDWLFCRDGKWRPVEPGTFPLADGPPARVGRLRGYGNAIVAPQAQVFIESYMEATNG